MNIKTFDQLRDAASEYGAVADLLNFAAMAGRLAQSSGAGDLSEDDLAFLEIVEMANTAAQADRDGE